MNNHLYNAIQSMIALTTIASFATLSVSVTGLLLFICTILLVSVSSFSFYATYKARQQTDFIEDQQILDEQMTQATNAD